MGGQPQGRWQRLLHCTGTAMSDCRSTGQGSSTRQDAHQCLVLQGSPCAGCRIELIRLPRGCMGGQAEDVRQVVRWLLSSTCSRMLDGIPGEGTLKTQRSKSFKILCHTQEYLRAAMWPVQCSGSCDSAFRPPYRSHWHSLLPRAPAAAAAPAAA